MAAAGGDKTQGSLGAGKNYLEEAGMHSPMSVVRKSAKDPGANTTTAYVKNPQGPPLDYSFLEIRTIEELREVMPRSGYRKEPPETIEDDNGQPQPNHLRDEWTKPPRDDLQTNALKLGNNLLTSLPPVFNIILREVMDKPRNLSWIDLSFNQLEEVPAVLASHLYSRLNVIYLHANRIRKISQAACLSDLPTLRSITLHGNPCEQTTNYRLHAIGIFTTIKSLDFTTITAIDREKANTFYNRYLAQKEQRRSADKE
mmetsp:Transcript_42252/g.99175  ORF Transcript_42252/g.99175 Transcript_42252/m.99175 type:complete len:257 (+) Transcript_42252:1-771(+)